MCTYNDKIAEIEVAMMFVSKMNLSNHSKC